MLFFIDNDDINAPKFIAVKEDGVYIATTSAVIKYYSNDDHDNHKEILALNNSLQWFDITNPGSQPLPERKSTVSCTQQLTCAVNKYNCSSYCT